MDLMKEVDGFFFTGNVGEVEVRTFLIVALTCLEQLWPKNYGKVDKTVF